MLTVIDALLWDTETGRPVKMLPNVWPAGDLPELDYLHTLIDCADVTEDARQDAHDRADELLELYHKQSRQSRRNARRDALCKDFDSGKYNDILRGYIVLTAKAAGVDPEPLLDVLPRVLDDHDAREALRAQ